jgi:hypothetical protein
MNNRPIRLTTDANVSTAEPAILSPQVQQSDELGRALARIYRRILAFGGSADAIGQQSASSDETAPAQPDTVSDWDADDLAAQDANSAPAS